VDSLELTFRSAPRAVCRIRVGRGARDALIDELAAAPPGRRLVLVSDGNVHPLYAVPLARRLRARGLAVDDLSFPAGEQHKTRESKDRLEDALLELGVGRDAAIVAVGGGVTGDLAGFLAATWHRGVPVVQVPTSLLAMVDAAVGGKTAVNLEGGKNLVGAFHQPWGVYADVGVLATLPEREYREGFAEVVKSAVIADARLFRRLEERVGSLLGRDDAELAHVVLRCVEIKGSVVRRDEREAGRRGVLNFGHTVAHAIEAVSGYGVSHGAAVAIGMAVESSLAGQVHGFSGSASRRVADLLGAFGLPVRIPSSLDIDALIGAMRRDKKTRAGRVRFALPRRIGSMPGGDGTSVHVEEDVVRRAVQAAVAD
jgi:3-dehydroquinate synthase